MQSNNGPELSKINDIVPGISENTKQNKYSPKNEQMKPHLDYHIQILEN